MERFEEIVDRCQRKVFTYAVYVLGDRGEAEDVTQEVFLKLWRDREWVEGERALSWLLRVTRNACYDRLRHRRAVSRHVSALDDARLASLPDTRPDAHQQAEAEEFRRRLATALSSLSEPMKSAIVLFEVQGFKYREIAEVLDLPLNTVRVHIHRGRRRIRRQLEKGACGETRA